MFSGTALFLSTLIYSCGDERRADSLPPNSTINDNSDGEGEISGEGEGEGEASPQIIDRHAPHIGEIADITAVYTQQATGAVPVVDDISGVERVEVLLKPDIFYQDLPEAPEHERHWTDRRVVRTDAISGADNQYFFTLQAQSLPGMYQFKIIAVDNEGNESSKTGVLYVLDDRTDAMKQEPGNLLCAKAAQWHGFQRFILDRNEDALAELREEDKASIEAYLSGLGEREFRTPLGSVDYNKVIETVYLVKNVLFLRDGKETGPFVMFKLGEGYQRAYMGMPFGAYEQVKTSGETLDTLAEQLGFREVCEQ